MAPRSRTAPEWEALGRQDCKLQARGLDGFRVRVFCELPVKAMGLLGEMFMDTNVALILGDSEASLNPSLDPGPPNLYSLEGSTSHHLSLLHLGPAWPIYFLSPADACQYGMALGMREPPQVNSGCAASGSLDLSPVTCLGLSVTHTQDDAAPTGLPPAGGSSQSPCSENKRSLVHSKGDPQQWTSPKGRRV